MNSGIKSLPSVQLLGMIDLGACPAVFENSTLAFLASRADDRIFLPLPVHYSSNTPTPLQNSGPFRGYLVTPTPPLEQRSAQTLLSNPHPSFKPCRLSTGRKATTCLATQSSGIQQGRKCAGTPSLALVFSRSTESAPACRGINADERRSEPTAHR